ncbi:MAG: DJ-1/PfpI family protein [Patescibacteria group bacterium]
MTKHALFVIAPADFRDEELFEPQKVLQDAGVEITIASREPGEVIGKLGGKAKAQIGINQVNAEDFDAVIFVGGPGAATYFADPAAHLLAQKAVKSGKILAAICIAPTVLANAGVLKGKKATVFPSPDGEKALADGGASYTKANVEVDGKIITANGPEAATEFGEKILELLGE